MNKDSKIYIAGHRGLVGSALMRRLTAAAPSPSPLAGEGRGEVVNEGKNAPYTNIITRTHAELDLTDQQAVREFFEKEKPEYVFLAAAKVGGIALPPVSRDIIKPRFKLSQKSTYRYQLSYSESRVASAA